jgi:hypothetical protein
MASLLRRILERTSACWLWQARCWQPVLAASKVVVLALGLQALIVSSADGSCGDWLAHPPENRASATTSLPNEAGSRQDEGDAPRDGQPTGARPCRGVWCGKAPMAPPPMPVPFPTVNDQMASTVDSAAGDVDDLRFALVSCHDAAPRAGFARRIEHPPRA